MSSTVIIGKHAVRQFLNSDKHVEKLFIRQRQKETQDIREIIAIAKNKKIQLQWLQPSRFDQRFSGDHQGIACITHDFEQASLDDLIKAQPNIILMADHIEDPHNFGAICRTAEAYGINTVCYPKNRAVQITPSVIKASAGALESMTVCKLTNLSQALKKLTANGYWVYAASSNSGESLNNINFNFPMVLICGSEHKGISPILASSTDHFVHIPLKGQTSSLNVSVAIGIIIHKILS